MGEYKKSGFGGDRKKSFGKPSFGGGKRFGDRPSFGGDRPSFGGDRGGRPSFGRPGDRPAGFKTTCDQCHKACEVPFRPNGDKPVYCNDCFAPMRDAAGSDFNDRPVRNDRPARSDDRDNRSSSFGKHEFGGASVARPGVDAVRFEEFKKQLDTLNTKVDKILLALNAQDIMTNGNNSTLENLVTKAKKAEKNVESVMEDSIEKVGNFVDSMVSKAKKETKPMIKAAKKTVAKVVAKAAPVKAKATKAAKPAAKAVAKKKK